MHALEGFAHPIRFINPRHRHRSLSCPQNSKSGDSTLCLGVHIQAALVQGTLVAPGKKQDPYSHCNSGTHGKKTEGVSVSSGGQLICGRYSDDENMLPFQARKTGCFSTAVASPGMFDLALISFVYTD